MTNDMDDRTAGEIESIRHILENSIDAHYGMSNEPPLTKEEHYIFWDRMWQLMQTKTGK